MSCSDGKFEARMTPKIIRLPRKQNTNSIFFFFWGVQEFEKNFFYFFSCFKNIRKLIYWYFQNFALSDPKLFYKWTNWLNHHFGSCGRQILQKQSIETLKSCKTVSCCTCQQRTQNFTKLFMSSLTSDWFDVF